MLTHNDLKKQGLKLSQPEAQLMHSKINGISQGYFTDGIVYPDMGTTNEKQKSDPLKEYYAELQIKNNALLKENAELREQLKLATTLKAMPENINKQIILEHENENAAEIIKQKAKPGPKSKKDVNNP